VTHTKEADDPDRVEQLAECQLYIVRRSTDDEDLIFVAEVWSEPAAQAALLDPRTQER
jgi:quinol monooxygenase YgiN